MSSCWYYHFIPLTCVCLFFFYLFFLVSFRTFWRSRSAWDERSKKRWTWGWGRQRERRRATQSSCTAFRQTCRSEWKSTNSALRRANVIILAYVGNLNSTHFIVSIFTRNYQSHSFSPHTQTGPWGVPGGGVPAGLGVGLAERGGRAPAAGRRRAGEEKGETGRASQADPGRGGETGWHCERCGWMEGENNERVPTDQFYRMRWLHSYMYNHYSMTSVAQNS